LLRLASGTFLSVNDINKCNLCLKSCVCMRKNGDVDFSVK